jgi:DNA-binding FadR family transcriptional regulator
LLQAQAILQPGAVALAAVARSPEDVAALRKVVQEVKDSADPVQFADAAAAFLDLLLHVSHNKMLALMSELTEELLHAELRTELSTASAPEGRDIIRWSAKQYARLVDLIEAGESDLAEAFWREHLRVTRPFHNEVSPLEVYRPWRRQDPVRYPWQGAQD